MIKSIDQKGFTLIELMISMTFFSFILVLVSTGFVQINKSYTRGLVQKNIQNAARSVMEDISDHIRNADVNAASTKTDSSPYRLCIGGTTYAFNKVEQNGSTFTLSDEKFDGTADSLSLVRTSTLPNCDDPIPADENLETLVDEGIIVQYLEIDLPTVNSDAIRITMTLSTDNLEDFEEYGLDARCKVTTGDQYCYAVRLRTIVSARN